LLLPLLLLVLVLVLLPLVLLQLPCRRLGGRLRGVRTLQAAAQARALCLLLCQAQLQGSCLLARLLWGCRDRAGGASAIRPRHECARHVSCCTGGAVQRHGMPSQAPRYA
jgi:hypothetical protein